MAVDNVKWGQVCLQATVWVWESSGCWGSWLIYSSLCLRCKCNCNSVSIPQKKYFSWWYLYLYVFQSWQKRASDSRPWWPTCTCAPQSQSLLTNLWVHTWYPKPKITWHLSSISDPKYPLLYLIHIQTPLDQFLHLLTLGFNITLFLSSLISAPSIDRWGLL